MTPKLRAMLDARKLARIDADPALVRKEVEGAESDLEAARGSLSREMPKWATVQAYYSMFHAARALLYGAGYREKSHRALLAALDELFVRAGRMGRVALQRFEDAMDLREEADYGLTFSEEGARTVVADAGEFLRMAKELLESGRAAERRAPLAGRPRR